MRFRASLAAALLASLSLAAVPALAAERHLGSTKLSRHENDVDVINLPGCGRRGRGGIREVKMKVHKGTVEVEKLWVRFENGDVDRLDVRERIPEGGETRWIDLKGGKRCVRAIGIIGDTEKSVDQARVDFFGR